MLESNLRKIMAENKIDDITELMNLTGISRNSINKLYRENEMETLKLETLIKICETFSIRLSDLVQYTPDSFVDHKAIHKEELRKKVWSQLSEQRKEINTSGNGSRKIAEERASYDADNNKIK